MSNPETRFIPEQKEQIMRIKRSREDILGRYHSGETNCQKSDLRGVNFGSDEESGVSGDELDYLDFSYSDVRGINLDEASIENTNWTETVMSDLGPEDAAVFTRVNARKAKFGYKEKLTERRARHTREYKQSRKRPKVEDTAALFNFDGREGNFEETEWREVDFGGSTDSYEALFTGANFKNARLIGCDLSQIDFSSVNIEGLKIIDGFSVKGLIITEDQAEELAGAIEFTNEKEQTEFKKRLEENGARGVLEEIGVKIIQK